MMVLVVVVVAAASLVIEVDWYLAHGQGPALHVDVDTTMQLYSFQAYSSWPAGLQKHASAQQLPKLFE